MNLSEEEHYRLFGDVNGTLAPAVLRQPMLRWSVGDQRRRRDVDEVIYAQQEPRSR